MITAKAVQSSRHDSLKHEKLWNNYNYSEKNNLGKEYWHNLPKYLQLCLINKVHVETKKASYINLILLNCYIRRKRAHKISLIVRNTQLLIKVGRAATLFSYRLNFKWDCSIFRSNFSSGSGRAWLIFISLPRPFSVLTYGCVRGWSRVTRPPPHNLGNLGILLK